jgi:hypothetical protein
MATGTNDQAGVEVLLPEVPDRPWAARHEASASSAESAPGSGLSGWWDVKICIGAHQITRLAYYCATSGGVTTERPEPEEVIWPTWPATTGEETAISMSPLGDLQQYWSTSGDRLRESAKWMATVLGAAMASVIGTSPLASLSSHHFHVTAALIGLAGLTCLGATMVLVLRVMQPPAVFYHQMETAQPPSGIGRLIPAWLYRHQESALYRWQRAVDSHQDLYLPCGVTSLTDLRQSVGLEEATLVQLAQSREDTQDPAACKKLARAQAARAARLLELRTAATRITAIGEYYALRARSTQATYGGTAFGIIGTAAVVLMFAWPLK